MGGHPLAVVAFAAAAVASVLLWVGVLSFHQPPYKSLESFEGPGGGLRTLVQVALRGGRPTCVLCIAKVASSQKSGQRSPRMVFGMEFCFQHRLAGVTLRSGTYPGSF